MTSQQDVIQSLPSHLRAFVATQDYANYSPRDHAVWRFLLHQLKDNLSQSAHPTYLQGLRKTGISLDAIPRIEHINACLNELGWRAVVVDGFLPPAIFMEFQAIKVLVIAVNMRSFEHMMYTPAPDIVHESAGHAPFLIDIDYAEFLQRFGELGMRAVADQNDIEIYQAIRHLSIVKEAPNTSAQTIADANQRLAKLYAKATKPSEAALLARLHWWTVEYGLVGDLGDYSIYGAGLLSSLAESTSCLDDEKVQKLRLTVDAIDTSYNITDPQPQLFITQSCRHLSQVLEEYGRHMCCQRGGASALREALEAASVNTVILNSGLQVAGQVSDLICDAVGNAIYFNTSGPTQLCFDHKEIEGQGIQAHAQGFGSPVGRLLAMERCLSCYTVDELKRHHIEVGQLVELNFLSGIRVIGKLEEIYRREQKNILMSFSNCTVIDRNGEILFDPAWGVYDMAVGDSVVAVRGGSADQRRFPLYNAPIESAASQADYDRATLDQFDLYSRIRQCRETNEGTEQLARDILELTASDWLLRFEALELLADKKVGADMQQALLQSLHSEIGDPAILIKQGLARLGIGN